MARKPVVLFWKGEEVSDQVLENVSAGLDEFALRAEANSKRELRRGRGVASGTLRRSLHTARPGFDWSSDNVDPSSSTPDRGGQKFNAVINGKRVTIQLGSGLNYALAVHQGHHGFTGYHYITNGVDKTQPELPSILEKHRMKK
jgi:hypothetical protein